MDYVFIFLLQFIGCALHVIPKVKAIDARCNNDSPSEVWRIFFNEDWITLFGSLVILLLDIVLHAAVDVYDLPIGKMTWTIPGTEIVVTYIGASLLMALFLGYAGQRVIYSILGKAEAKAIEKFGKKD